MTAYPNLFDESIVIDATSPLLMERKFIDMYRSAGVTAVAPTVGLGGLAADQVKTLGAWLHHIRRDANLLVVRSARDIERAKQQNRLGLIFHFQGTDSIEDDLDLLDAYYALGVRIIQLTYNVKNRVGDGCTERTDSGLSNFGVQLIERMNELGIAVDCSHTGLQTTLDAMTVSKKPVIFSHANMRSVFDNRRNISNRQLHALAETGGVIGFNIVPYYLTRDPVATIDQLIDHMDHCRMQIGVEHIGIGFDYFAGQQPFVSDDEAHRIYRQFVEAGRWDETVYPPPTQQYPEALRTPAQIANLVPALTRRGYADHEIRQILGGNWMRVFREIWGD